LGCMWSPRAHCVAEPATAPPSMAGVNDDGPGTDPADAPPAAVISASVMVTTPTRPFHDTTPDEIAANVACTNAVVATLVSLSFVGGVGARGLPVKIGSASGAPPTLAT